MSEAPPTKEQKVAFGPFTNVPFKLIHPAGFNCPLCGQLVKCFGIQTPTAVPRMMIYSCGCGSSVVTWEDERQPTSAKHWRRNIQLAHRANVGVVVFNGGKDTPPGFQGIN
jgi:hypothetical protein